nr:hypothetical protein [Tanacetum cinerariifolium]
MPENGEWHLAQEPARSYILLAVIEGSCHLIAHGMWSFYRNQDDLNSGKAIICFLLSYRLQELRKLSGSQIWERANGTNHEEVDYDVILMPNIPYQQLLRKRCGYKGSVCRIFLVQLKCSTQLSKDQDTLNFANVTCLQFWLQERSRIWEPANGMNHEEVDYDVILMPNIPYQQLLRKRVCFD